MKNIKLGILTDLKQINENEFYTLKSNYISSIRKAINKSKINTKIITLFYDSEIPKNLNGIILIGGGKYSKNIKGKVSLKKANPKRYEFEKKLILFAKKNQIPILGICRGYQMINEVFGGKTKYISEFTKKLLKHNGEEIIHKVFLNKNSRLYDIFKKPFIETNSFHLKCISKVAKNFKVTGKSYNGIIESIESLDSPVMIGVQWHPEAQESMQPLFSWFLNHIKP